MRMGLGFPEVSEGMGGPGGRYLTLWIQQFLVQAVLHVLVAGPAWRTRPRAVAGYARHKGRRQGCTRAGGGLCLSLDVGTDKIGREISLGGWGARLFP
jgi:hypothetical protein